ncbi:MAG: hypothetical protein V1740_05415 [Candidatus Woesearchaeota archaeon]
MKKTLGILGIALLLGILPFVLADEGTGTIGGEVTVGGGSCSPPEIFLDPTARLWNPNYQTRLTAIEYGINVTNDYNDTGYEVGVRQNYVFEGETLAYYVAVYDQNGASDIDDVTLLVGGVGVGACAPRDLETEAPGATLALRRVYLTDHFGLDPALTSTTTSNYAFYACTLIVQSNVQMSNETGVTVQVTDGDANACTNGANVINSTWSDQINFNPTLSVTFIGGSVDFGEANAGSTAVSNTVYVINDAAAGSGVVMDMYIASDNYFYDSTNPGAICGLGNGIPYYAFKYYATKGSLDSGDNDNTENGIGTDVNDTNIPGDICAADDDEFTYVPSQTGDIDDMCRIINHVEGGSFLTQGSEMSMTFKLEVPTPCSGTFDTGEFHLVGRIV